jgi:hypothetical protein
LKERDLLARMDSAEDLAWASNLLGLELHRLDQVKYI